MNVVKMPIEGLLILTPTVYNDSRGYFFESWSENLLQKNNTELKLDDLCEECQKKDESVIHNLILTGFKICKSCRVSKTIFPI